MAARTVQIKITGDLDFGKAAADLKSQTDKMVAQASKVSKSFKESLAGVSFKGIASGVSEAFSSAAGKAKTAFKGIPGKIASEFTELPGKIAGMFKELPGKIAGGFKGLGKKLAATVGEGLKSALQGVGVGAGLALSKALSDGFGDALDFGASTEKLRSSLGEYGAEGEQLGRIAGELYANAYGDSVGEIATTLGTISQVAGNVGEETLAALAGQATSLGVAFDGAGDEYAQLAGQLKAQGVVSSVQEGLDYLTVSSQKVPAALRGDLSLAVKEYSVFTDALGFTTAESFGVLTKAASKGTYALDKTGDALKEFQIRSTDMSAATSTAYEAIGVSTVDATRDILAGGERANGAFKKIVDGLLAIEDPAEQSAAAIALFGTPLEDIGVDQIPAFLKDLDTMGQGFEDVEGAAAKLDAELNDNLKTKLETFRRTALKKFTDVMTQFVIPALEKFGEWIGPRLAPLIETLQTKVTQFFDVLRGGDADDSKVAKFAKTIRDDIAPAIAAAAPKILAFGAVIAGLVAKFAGVVAVLVSNKPVIIGILAAIAVGFGFWAAGAIAAAAATVVAALPIIAIGVAIAAVVAALIWAYDNFELFRTVIDAVAAAGKKFISLLIGWGKAVYEWVKSFDLSSIPAAFSAVWAAVKAGLSAAWAAITGAIGAGLSAVVALFTLYKDLVVAVWGGLWQAVKLILSTAWDGFKALISAALGAIGAVISGAFDFIVGLFNTFTTILKTVWGAVWEAVKLVVTVVWDAIRQKISDVLATIEIIVRTGSEILKSVWDTLWTTVKTVTGAAWDAIRDRISGALETVKGLISDAKTAIKSRINETWDGVKDLTTKAWTSIKTKVSSGVDKIVEFLKGLPGKVAKAITPDAFGSVYKAFEKVVGKVKDLWNKLSFSTPKVSTPTASSGSRKLPQFASGNVAYGTTLGVFGEYAGARSNPEITAPQSMMAETFRSVLQEHGSSGGPAIHIENIVVDRDREVIPELALWSTVARSAVGA